MKQKNVFCICPKCSLDCVPFRNWLYYSYDVTNYKKLHWSKLETYWLEYRAWSVENGFLYEASEKFHPFGGRW